MGRYTAIISFSGFLVLQLFQGVILCNFLCREVRIDGQNDMRQWLWLFADLSVFLFWTTLLLCRRSRLITVDMPLIPVPTMAVAWAVYLVFVLVPRVTWIMRDAGNCIGSNYTGNNTTLAGVLAVEEVAEWDGNALKVTLSVGSTLMMFTLAVAGYGQHGLLGSQTALDFDIAEAAFSIVDGVEFLGVYWENDVIERCGATTLNCSSADTRLTTLHHTSGGNTLDSYICQLQGRLGIYILAVAACSFALPFFALWQFKRRSAALKADDFVDGETQRLASLDCTQDDESGLLAKEGAPISLSVHHLDIVSHRRNVKTKQHMAREQSVLKILYILWDLFLVNLAGGAIRLILWLKFSRPISALITKNILSAMFRCINIMSDFIVPWYQTRRRPKPDGDQQATGMTGLQSLRRVMKRPGAAVKAKRAKKSLPANEEVKTQGKTKASGASAPSDLTPC